MGAPSDRRGPGLPFGGHLHQGEVVLAQNKQRLELAVGHGLFSGATVDVGTLLLLRTLGAPELEGVGVIEDLGCGYGPLGIALAARAGARSILVDRDAVAVAYAAHNARVNGVEGVEARPGLGWPGTDADLLVSNIPAKAGPATVESMLLGGSASALRAVVVIERIGSEVEAALGRAGAEIVLRKANRQHLALHYRLPPRSDGPPRGATTAPHRRGRRTFSAGKLSWEAETAWGLAEFDTLSRSTKLAIRLLRGVHPRPGLRALVVEPGVGHLAVATALLMQPEHLATASRDLLALEMTALNLGGTSDAEGRHTPFPDAPAGSVDLAVVSLDPKLPAPALTELARRLADQTDTASRVLAAGTSTAVQRFSVAVEAAKLPLIPLERVKDKGDAAADFVRR